MDDCFLKVGLSCVYNRNQEREATADGFRSLVLMSLFRSVYCHVNACTYSVSFNHVMLEILPNLTCVYHFSLILNLFWHGIGLEFSLIGREMVVLGSAMWKRSSVLRRKLLLELFTLMLDNNCSLNMPN